LSREKYAKIVFLQNIIGDGCMVTPLNSIIDVAANRNRGRHGDVLAEYAGGTGRF